MRKFPHRTLDLPNQKYFSEKAVQQRLLDHLDALCLKDFDFSDETKRKRIQERCAKEKRVRERARKLVDARKEAHGLEKLDRKELKRIMGAIGRTHVTALLNSHRADEIASEIHDQMPWMASATIEIHRMLRRSVINGKGAVLRPIKLNGPYGIGKSHFACSVARMLEVPYLELDATKTQAGFNLTGLERGWSGATPGRPIEEILRSRIANPVIVLDEICKAGTATTTNGVQHSSIERLLSKLETNTATEWECPYYQVTFDLTHLSWIMTSNQLNTISEGVRSRCQIVDLPDVSAGDLCGFADRKAAELDLSEASIWAIHKVIKKTFERGQRLSLRDVVRMADRAIALQEEPVLH